MSQVTLQWIFNRKKDIARLVKQAIGTARGPVCVEDMNGNILLGTALPEGTDSFPVLIEHEKAGQVTGAPEAAFIAQLLNQCIAQEVNKKKLGTELLHQYKEINLIYTFSEKLAPALRVETIATLLLQEAGQIIRFYGGAVIFLEETSREMIWKASVGNDFSRNSTDGQNEDSFIREITQNGKSDITILPESVLSGKPAPILLYAALKVRDKVLGAIILKGEETQEFSAADLKLLTTLAFQAAAAMESVLLHEKAMTHALKEQRKQLVFDLAQKHPFFKKVLSIIQSNLGNPDFSVERLSKAMSLSPSQLQRKTVSLSDRSPVQIIRELRLQKAKELLLHSDLTVAEIAFQTGFNDPSYFTRLFTKETGMTPSVWKENPAAE